MHTDWILACEGSQVSATPRGNLLLMPKEQSFLHTWQDHDNHLNVFRGFDILFNASFWFSKWYGGELLRILCASWIFKAWTKVITLQLLMPSSVHIRRQNDQHILHLSFAAVIKQKRDFGQSRFPSLYNQILWCIELHFIPPSKPHAPKYNSIAFFLPHVLKPVSFIVAFKSARVCDRHHSSL